MTDNLYFYKGRVALFAALKALGIKPGDEVILPGFTCVVVPNAISYLGAKPVYADIDPATYNIDPRRISENITGRTRAIIAQHTFGIPAEMTEIRELAGNHGLYVIEDSCHAVGSRYKGREVGTFGDAAFFSSQWSKPVTTGFGGWVKINNPELKEKMDEIYSTFSNPSLKDDMSLRLQYFLHAVLLKPSLFWFAQDTYRTLTKYGIVAGSSSNDELQSRMPANYERTMTPWQKNTLEQKLADIPAVIKHRKEVVAQYEKLLPAAGIAPLKLPDCLETVFLRYPVPVKDKARVMELAKRNRIEMGDWFSSPVHPNLSGWEKISYEKGMCPHAEKACEQVVNLPTHKGIGAQEIEKTFGFINKFREVF